MCVLIAEHRHGGSVSYSTILYEIEESILTITLNRPDALNAFNNDMLEELLDACDRADADDDVKAIIVTGAGRAFCAGADLSSGGNTFNSDTRTITVIQCIRSYHIMSCSSKLVTSTVFVT